VTRKQRRMAALLACGIGVSGAAALALSAMSDSIVFFVPPAQLAAQPEGRTIRLGGLVEAGSLARGREGAKPVAHFRLTDGQATVAVTYAGVLPDLFREGQGAVTLGKRLPDGSFRAQEVLAKHDETYMPPDVAQALQKTGRWRPEQGAPPPASTWNTLGGVMDRPGSAVAEGPVRAGG
jgi:cytochrome c-type biogenesis protein CcmE